MAQRYRPRKQFKFWLFHDKPDEVRLMEYIDYLRKAPGVTFADTVRNGLRLMWSLREGETTVLFELFPGLKATLQAAPASGGGELERQIDDLKKLITQYRNEATMHDAPLVAAGAPPVKLSALQPIAATVDDDDEQDTIILKRSTSTDAGKNFLGSLASFK